MNRGNRLLLQNFNYFSYGVFIYTTLQVLQETKIYRTKDVKLNFLWIKQHVRSLLHECGCRVIKTTTEKAGGHKIDDYSLALEDF